MSTHRLLFPCILLVEVTSAILIQMTAWAVTWRHWPWVSTRVTPFIIVAGMGFMVGARVLVTGDGGSIGSRPCRRTTRFRPQQLITVDHNKSALHAVHPALDEEGELDSPAPVLTAPRTPGFTSSLFDRYPPTIIFSAAGLKHPTLTERCSLKVFLANVTVTVTRDLLGAAEASGVQRFINISTDKVAAPTCVLDDTQRLAERRPQLPTHVHQLWQHRHFAWADARAKALGTQRGAFLENAWLIAKPVIAVLVLVAVRPPHTWPTRSWPLVMPVLILQTLLRLGLPLTAFALFWEKDNGVEG